MIVLTDTASSKVAELLAQEGDEGLVLRVGVRPGGCAGMNYETVSYTHLTLPTTPYV